MGGSSGDVESKAKAQIVTTGDADTIATSLEEFDGKVTDERTEELLRRIVEKADPLQIIMFGSRARGDHRPDSDLDIAVILDAPQEEVRQRLPYTVIRGSIWTSTWLKALISAHQCA